MESAAVKLPSATSNLGAAASQHLINICMHWFLCIYNGFARTFVHIKLWLFKIVTVVANLCNSIYDVQIENIFPIYFAIH